MKTFIVKFYDELVIEVQGDVIINKDGCVIILSVNKSGKAAGLASFPYAGLQGVYPKPEEEEKTK